MMENETIELTYERATLGKRIAAFLVDAFLSLLTGAIFLLLTFYLLSVSPFMKSIYQQRDDIQLNSHLYIKNDSNNIIQLKESISKDTALTIKEKNKKYDDALTYFFDSNLFFNENEGNEIYKNLKENAKGDENNNLFNNDGIEIYDDSLHNDRLRSTTDGKSPRMPAPRTIKTSAFSGSAVVFEFVRISVVVAVKSKANSTYAEIIAYFKILPTMLTLHHDESSG